MGFTVPTAFQVMGQAFAIITWTCWNPKWGTPAGENSETMHMHIFALTAICIVASLCVSRFLIRSQFA